MRAHAPYERVLSAREMPGATLVPGRAAELRRARARAATRTPSRVAVIAHSQTRGPIELTLRRAARAGGAGPRRAAAARRRPRRPGRRLPAEHPRDAGRVPGHREPRRDLGELRARVRRRAASIDRFGQIEPKVLLAVDGYRYGEQGRSTAATRSPRSARALPTLEHVVARPLRRHATTPCRTRSTWDELLAEPGHARVRRRCRSTTRCTCCSPPAPPGCRRRSCTATAASCSST